MEHLPPVPVNKLALRIREMLHPDSKLLREEFLCGEAEAQGRHSRAELLGLKSSSVSLQLPCPFLCARGAKGRSASVTVLDNCRSPAQVSQPFYFKHPEGGPFANPLHIPSPSPHAFNQHVIIFLDALAAEMYGKFLKRGWEHVNQR